MSVARPLAELVAYLDEYLRIFATPDEPNAVNGLQAESTRPIGRIVAAVDASLATITAASPPRQDPGNDPTAGATLLLVHHGMFWDGNVPLTGRRYQRVRALLDRDLALYAAHIPLDIHPEVGNNFILARRLGLSDLRPFGDYKGVSIGVSGTPPGHVTGPEHLADSLAAVLPTPRALIRVIPGAPDRIGRVGIITGGAGSMIAAAREAGIGTFITGEGAAHTYFDAMEWGINLIYAGHYATETVGVQALAAHLSDRFGLAWEFHDHPTGM